jgi:uncharacterized membrane protein
VNVFADTSKNFPTAEPFHTTVVWGAPWLGIAFLAVAAVLLVLSARRLAGQDLGMRRVMVLTVLRVIPIVLLALLLARPVRVTSRDEAVDRKVVLLVDRSASMALTDMDGRPRFTDALSFARDVVLPDLQAAGYHIQPMLFDAEANPATGEQLVAAKPTGDATDLGTAISAGLGATDHPPLAIIALTDGAANQPQSNRGAASSLLAARTPFVGVGFGSERGVQTLNLREIDAPKITPPKSRFRIAARIEATAGKLPAFNLVLLRDGKFHQKRSIESVSGSRYWSESFELTEEEEGLHTYEVQIEPPAVADLLVANAAASATVSVTREQELRVLYMQGALAWDYKFIGRALRNDPTLHVTGLSRTSERSVFRQNVEAPGELVDGFPDDVKELAPFRVVVLANLSPKLLNPQQQEAIARFCGDFGGGVLMIGGHGTFDASWRGSRLEQLLPVRFEDDRGVRGLDQPFQFQLTAEALSDPVFEIAEPGKARQAWTKLPAFNDYGRIASAKPGATIWAVHNKDVGPDGKPRILMAAQPYGSGTTAVIAVQNFWKWGLAKECDETAFGRFWQQFIRRLAESGRQPVRIEVLDQELRPGIEIGLSIEKLADPAKPSAEKPGLYRFQVRTSNDAIVTDRQIELKPGHPERLAFIPPRGDHYTVEVKEDTGTSLASRVLEIRAPNIELQKSARDMETLRQWAMISGGSAWEVEEARGNPGEFGSAIRAQIEAARFANSRREPIGANVWAFLLILLPLCAGWVLRKQWMLR